MARIRSIRPEFCQSETIARLPIPVRLHFVQLWTYADDEGRGLDNPRLLKGDLWPLDDDVDLALIDEWQEVLEAEGRIVRYEVNGRRYFEVVNFREHQHPQRPGKTKYPAPDEGSRTPPRAVAEDSGKAHLRRVGEGREEESRYVASKPTSTHVGRARQACRQEAERRVAERVAAGEGIVNPAAIAELVDKRDLWPVLGPSLTAAAEANPDVDASALLALAGGAPSSAEGTPDPTSAAVELVMARNHAERERLAAEPVAPPAVAAASIAEARAALNGSGSA